MGERQQPRPDQDNKQEFVFRNVHLFKTETLGTGSYGVVCKAKCDTLICAAKLIYPILFEIIPQAPEPGKEHRQPFHRFELECRFLSLINHPNIVQYLGTYRDPETNAPVLLMELMDESLTHYLESSQEQVLYHMQVSICHDIAQALAFLHSNGIIHRDLSSNNILLIAGSRAKVTDFGMSKFGTSHIATMTTCPGTPAFMSPEALSEPPVYTEKLDNFSLGVVIIQVLTRKFPKPSDRFQVIHVENPRAPTNTVRAQIPVPEIERRHTHISLIAPTHPLLAIALHCLKDEEVERPSSHHLVQTIGALKESAMYKESAQQDKDQLLRAKDEQILAHVHEIQTKTQQLHAKDELLQAKVGELDQAIRENEERVQQLRVLNQQVESNEEITAVLRHTVTQKEREVADLQFMISSKDEQIQDMTSRLRELEIQKENHQEQAIQESADRINLVWKSVPEEPVGMWAGSSTVVGNKAYFQTNKSREIYEYNSQSKKWCLMSQHHFYGFSIVCVNDVLTSVGGGYATWSNERFTNFNFSEVYSLIDRKWIQRFPPMPTNRQTSALVYTKNKLVAAGGFNGEPLDIVEVLDTQDKEWCSAISLPFATWQASATICGDHIYMTAGYGSPEWEKKSVVKSSLKALVYSTEDTSKDQPVWEKIAELPMPYSSLATVKGNLLALGCRYNAAKNVWETVEGMSTWRTSCLTAVLPDDRLIVIGLTGNFWSNKLVESASVLY